MSNLSTAQKIILESALRMDKGYVLDFSDGTFANFFGDLKIDIYDTEQYPGHGGSKANRLRALWRTGSDAEVSVALGALADYVEAKTFVGDWSEDVTDAEVSQMREISRCLANISPVPAAGLQVNIATEASVTSNIVSIEIHEDIYSHIKKYLRTGDFFHAVGESYKIVREKLRELTGFEQATEVFNQSGHSDKFYKELFGKVEASQTAQNDFFRGVGYLHLGVQFLRNESAHTPASDIEANLAIHYISLASLAYDLITRYTSEEVIREVELVIQEKRKSYRSATAFYKDFDNHTWLENLQLPAGMKSAGLRRALKGKWLNEADLTRSYDYSNIVFMRLELVAQELTTDDIDLLLSLPTKDSYGNDQCAGLEQFLEFVNREDSGKLSSIARARAEKVGQS